MFLRKLFKKPGNYSQQPIDIGVCGVNLRPLNSRIVEKLRWEWLKMGDDAFEL